MKIRYLPDSFIEEEGKDLLGFNEFAKSTLAAIRYSEPPFTWGIYGDWGSGKTSLMKLIKGRMETDLKNPEPSSQEALHIPVWFNAWEYENELNIIYPLFYAIDRDFSARCKGAQ
ncbi:MAG TPA: P-loop NTPase fold protein, partial [Anaerolineales bacterium]|nr:P-loop NTPase fold protein [Anaerolineales bacterium]